ncbi:DUF421 domain-containing protein [Bacillus sp. RO2]|nr:DUF421 domain-containing protein [Bacillus sp. RO2]
MKDVDYTIFETVGQLSVLKKESEQPLTKYRWWETDIQTPCLPYCYRGNK